MRLEKEKGCAFFFFAKLELSPVWMLSQHVGTGLENARTFRGTQVLWEKHTFLERVVREGNF